MINPAVTNASIGDSLQQTDMKGGKIFISRELFFVISCKRFLNCTVMGETDTLFHKKGEGRMITKIANAFVRF